jgi:Ca2+:H+ antiporter
VSEVFVGSVQYAATSFGMSPAFIGFIVVALVGAAAEMAAAFSAARKNRLDLSVGIALGSAAQIALSLRQSWCCSVMCSVPRPWI